MTKQWYMYIVQCADHSYYTGITTDIHARVRSHNSGKGCKYTATRTPVRLIHYETYPDKSSALKREMQVKKLNKGKKEELVRGSPHRVTGDSG